MLCFRWKVRLPIHLFFLQRLYIFVSICAHKDIYVLTCAKCTYERRIISLLPENLIRNNNKINKSYFISDTSPIQAQSKFVQCLFRLFIITGVKTPCLTFNSSDRITADAHYMSLVMRKPVFGVCEQGRLKPATAVTEARYSTANEYHNEIDVRSTFTIQSYVRIDRFGIDYQSVIDQSNHFIHLPIIQSFKSSILLYRSIHSTKIRNRKTDEIHKSAQSVWCVLFI